MRLGFNPDELHYDQITFKTSQNAAAAVSKTSINQQLNFNELKLEDGACLGLSFDVKRTARRFTPGESIKKGHFKAHHGLSNEDLSVYLEQILAWHQDNSGHHPVLIRLNMIDNELKEYSDFHDEIDTYLKVYFDDTTLFRPDDLMEDGKPTMLENFKNAAEGEDPWPLINDSLLLGKFVFCISTKNDWAIQYANQEITKRSCFSSQLIGEKEMPPTTGNIVFFHFEMGDFNKNKWTETVQRFVSSHMITMASNVNSKTKWRDAIDAGVSSLGTTRVVGENWCVFLSGKNYVSKQRVYFLRCVANGRYRGNKATHMKKDFASPECDFVFEYRSGGEFAIKNLSKGRYYNCTIKSLSSTANSDCDYWKLEEAVIDDKVKANHYYIENVENEQHMTKKASQLSDNTGKDEVYIVDLIENRDKYHIIDL